MEVEIEFGSAVVTEQSLRGLTALLTQNWEGSRKGELKMPTSPHLASLTRLADVHSSVKRNTKTNNTIKIGCWNVRTLTDISNENRPARRTALIAAELNRYGTDIVALSETRLAEMGQIEEVGSGYTYFWIGKSVNEKRESGVGFAIRTSLLSKLEEMPVGINERIMSLRLRIDKGRFVTLFSVYAPTLNSAEESITSFYSQLRHALRSTPKDDKIILMGDFNARVGMESDTWNCLGPHGTGTMNSNGMLLLELCEEFGLCITNTYFQHKGDHLTTWMHPRSKSWHLIDYVIVRRRDLSDICNVKSFHGCECWTDHALVRAKVKFRIVPKSRHNSIQLPKRLNISKLADPDIKNDLVESFNQLSAITYWESFRDDMFIRTANILGFSTTNHQDWFDDNDAAIQNLLTLKRNIHTIALQIPSSSERSAAMGKYKAVKSLVQSELRKMEDKWWDNLATKTQEAAEAGDSKTQYNLLNKAFGPRKSSATPLRTKDGNSVLSKDTDIANRWKEHFSDLLNQQSVVDDIVIDSIEQRPTIVHMSDPPTSEEVIASIKRLNLGKAPGSDGLFAELYLLGGEHLQSLLHTFICKLWEDEYVPDDWVNAIMVAIYKNKGPREECGNYRGIALLVAAGKILAGVLLHRLNTHVASNVLPESQCGFRSNRSTVDMIFTARQIQEKCREQHMDLYQCFIDLQKAFDTVNRTALWKMLGKLGCPDKFVSMIKAFHVNMKAWVNVSGQLTDSINVENGVKQGHILGPSA